VRRRTENGTGVRTPPAPTTQNGLTPYQIGGRVVAHRTRESTVSNFEQRLQAIEEKLGLRRVQPEPVDPTTKFGLNAYVEITVGDDGVRNVTVYPDQVTPAFSEAQRYNANERPDISNRHLIIVDGGDNWWDRDGLPSAWAQSRRMDEEPDELVRVRWLS